MIRKRKRKILAQIMGDYYNMKKYLNRIKYYIKMQNKISNAMILINGSNDSINQKIKFGASHIRHYHRIFIIRNFYHR